MGAIQGASRHTAYRNKMTNESINWFARASQDEHGNNKTISNNLETALESQHITGVCESIQWAMEKKYRGTGNCELQEPMITNLLQNKIAMNKVISDLSEITSGLSIAVLIPGNKSSTEKKGDLDIFIPSSAKEFLDQLELFEAFLYVVFSKKSFVFKQCKLMRKSFEEHYQFLDSQFVKYGSTCGAHILKAVHNTFNTFFVKVKKDKIFKPQGIKLSLLDRCEEGEDMNIVIQNSNGKRENNHKSNKSNKKNNNNNGYNNNNNNRNNNSNYNNGYNNNNNNNSNNNSNKTTTTGTVATATTSSKITGFSEESLATTSNLTQSKTSGKEVTR